jgi:CheY-specific phosphatase CheX
MEFDLTLPKTITGSDKIIEHSVPGPVISLPFSTDAGQFFIEFCFR